MCSVFTVFKGLGTCDALLCVSHTLQSALESGQEARIVQIDFSAAITFYPFAELTFYPFA